MHWYLDVLKNYAGFSGRARRQEYWMYTLFNILAVIVVAIVSFVLFHNGLLVAVYYLAVLLPTLAVMVRRLHDTGKSGWWFFISLVPFVGGIILLVFLASEGERQPNAHGADPKAVPAYGQTPAY
ncbi:DUF805 domain-containing protein [Streptomyces sp. NBC_00344]|uniref:DUF805 domain-containing protein n=1 Tax=Streptomyces sp. NBC_00344 TaxID=2975720 RepID=UPI002E1DE48A